MSNVVVVIVVVVFLLLPPPLLPLTIEFPVFFPGGVQSDSGSSSRPAVRLHPACVAMLGTFCSAPQFSVAYTSVQPCGMKHERLLEQQR